MYMHFWGQDCHLCKLRELASLHADYVTLRIVWMRIIGLHIEENDLMLGIVEVVT